MANHAPHIAIISEASSRSFGATRPRALLRAVWAAAVLGLLLAACAFTVSWSRRLADARPYAPAPAATGSTPVVDATACRREPAVTA